MSKFKVGDKVVLIRNSRNCIFDKYRYIGQKGTIKDIIPNLSTTIQIKFDKKIDTDNWFVEDDLELVTSTSEEVIFEVGDEVKIIKGSFENRVGIISKILHGLSTYYVLCEDTKTFNNGLGFGKDIRHIKLIKKHNQGNNLTQTKTEVNHESIVSRKIVNVSNRQRPTGSSICGRRRKATVSSKSLSYTAINF